MAIISTKLGHYGKIINGKTQHIFSKETGMDVPVKLIKREMAYKGAVLDVYDDLVEIKGKQAHWDYIHHDGAAAVVPVTDEGKILMVRQYRHALKRYTLELPAGKVDAPGEPKLECAKRELEEETGYASDDFEHLIDLNTTVAFCDEFISIYVARNLRKTEQHLDDDEEIDVEEWDIDELIAKIYSFEITDSKTMAALLAYRGTLK